MPAFDSSEFSWSNISMVLAGKKIGGIQGVKYKWEQDQEFLYGSGNKPRGIQKGNIEVSGEIMLLQSEYDLLATATRAALGDPYAKVGELPGVDLVISYQAGLRIKTDTIFGVSFSSAEMGMEQNDKFMKISMPFLALDFIEGA